MEFRILGPLEVTEGGRPLPLGGPKQRLVLAHLLVRPNHVLSAERLIDEVWGEDPPDRARTALQVYISHLRSTLGHDRIESRAPGYLLRVGDGELDAARFEVLMDRARACMPTDPHAARETLLEALALWHGDAVADLAGEPSLRGEIARLEELRLSALEDRIEADLSLGRHSEAVAELESRTAAHPLRERLWGQLMLALYRSGRQADALAAFRRARELLSSELGVDPSPDLQRLHRRILAQDPSLELPGRPLRGYRLLERIGAGSFGVVYRATQPHVGREVAVKIVNPALANQPGFIRRFEVEAQLVARLEHPHIVPLYDFWREPDGAYLVMRWLRGGSLREALQDGPLELERTTPIVGQIASALASAHRERVIHRDVKPSNILLDEEGNAYLSDFGVAGRAMAAGLGDPTPTPSDPYSSPEELMGDPTTTRTDIYRLGLVVFEMLTGRHPFRDGTRREPRSLRELRPELPAGLDGVIARALAMDPADRFADPTALAEDLLQAAGGTLPRPAAVATTEPVPNPYKGLRPFGEADAADFFGREAAVERLLARLEEGGERSRFLAVVAPSGSGKSSVIRAGLIPAVRGGALSGSDRWYVAQLTPGDRPFEELRMALRRIAVAPPGDLVRALREEGGLLRAVETVLPDDGSELLLTVDQLEELFTLVENDEDRRRFLARLREAATDPDSRMRVVVALRADFYDRPLRYRGFAELLRARTETLVPLTPEELERAVRGPAERVGVPVEPGLIAEMVAEVVDEPGGLPLLQYALTELFERRDGGSLALRSYQELGGIAGALVRRAEELYGGFDARERAAARQVFLRLVTLGEGAGDTRRRVPRPELDGIEGGGGAVDAVVASFGGARLLSFDRDPQTREPTVEVAHEALLGTWERLRDWVASARDDVRMHRRLSAAAEEWGASGRDRGYLLREPRLARVEAWAAAGSIALTGSEREFLDASLRERETIRAEQVARLERERALERRSRTRLRALVAILAIAAVVSAGLSAFAFTQRGQARREAQRAERAARAATARELAAGAVANLEGDPELGILLALEAVETTRALDGTVLKEAEEALHRAVQASRVVATMRGLYGIQFSPDGTRLATSNADGTGRIWNPGTGEELLVLEGHTARTLSVDWSADGRLLATSSEDGTAKVWNTETGEELRTFEGHDAGLRSPHFSPDGALLATTSFDGTTRLWDTTTGEELLVLDHTGGVEFSPDGRRLVVSDPPVTVHEVPSGAPVLVLGEDIPDPRDATWSGDGRRIGVSDGDGFGHVFDATTGERLLTLIGHNARSVVGEIVFSRDDALIATTSSDGTVRIWDATTGLERLALPGLGGNVEGVDFSPDGRLVAGSSGSGVAKVWDIAPEGSREVLTIAGHRDIVYGMAFTPDGTRLITGSVDGTAAVWDAVSGARVTAILQPPGRVEHLALNPDGTSVITANEDGTARLWDAETGEELMRLEGHDSPVYSVAFSPDHDRIVTGAEDRTAALWDAQTGARVHTLEGHGGWVMATFSGDGTLVATGGQDETARVWDAATGELVSHMVRHQDNINAVTFSPDGSRLYTASEDGAVKVWDVRTGEELDAFTGHAAGLLDVAFSPDGTLLATAGRDGTARLWDPGSGRELLVLGGHTSGVSAVAFTPDGSRLAAAGEDGTVRIFVLSIEELTDLARERLTRGLTEDECRQYLRLPRCPDA